jgi:hypothetical protein
MNRTRMVGMVGLGLLGLAGTGASAQTMHYQNNFEGGWLDYRWGGNSRIMQDAPIFTTFNGWHSNAIATFMVEQPLITISANSFIQYTLLFDFYAFDSWDGHTTTSPDRFMVEVDGETMFDESFSNTPGRPQTFREPDMARANIGGRTSAPDAIYRNISLTFEAPAIADMKSRIRFLDGGLGGYSDESWGIDNIRLTYRVVPTPGAVGLALVGSVLMMRRRQRGA